MFNHLESVSHRVDYCQMYMLYSGTHYNDDPGSVSYSSYMQTDAVVKIFEVTSIIAYK